MSDTPRTEAVNQYLRTRRDYTKTDHEVWMNHGIQLERELNAANQRIDMLTACNADVARIAKERDDALKRINRLEEFVDQLTNPKFTREDLPKEALLQRIKRLEEAGDELVGTADAMDAWRKAKEYKL